MKKRLFFLVSIIFLYFNTTNAVTYNSEPKIFIQEFEINGDTRESFVIQKKIKRFSNKDSANKIKIYINLTKGKTIKEKNIQNKER